MRTEIKDGLTLLLFFFNHKNEKHLPLTANEMGNEHLQSAVLFHGKEESIFLNQKKKKQCL